MLTWKKYGHVRYNNNNNYYYNILMSLSLSVQINKQMLFKEINRNLKQNDAKKNT